jgi:phage host-nuclease inhibitor protein Gam
MIHIAIAYIVTGTVILLAVYLRQRYQSELKSINSSFKTQFNRAEHLSSLLDDSVQNNSVFKRSIQDLRSENNRLQSLLKDKDADIAARDRDIETFTEEITALKDQLTRFEAPERSAPVKRTRTRAVKK